MTDTTENRDRQPSTSDPRAGAPRPAQTGTVAKVGFDDPSLRPLPGDELDYHIPHPDAHPERHEHSDVPIRPLAWALFSIAALCVVSLVLLYWVFGRYDAQQKKLETPRTNVPAAKPAVPEPRLEGVPGFSDNPGTQDVATLRQRYQMELGGWDLTPESGFAQVPIDRAMDLAIERGTFKTAPQPPPAGAGGGGAAGTQKAPAQGAQQQQPQQRPPSQQQPPRTPPRREGPQ